MQAGTVIGGRYRLVRRVGEGAIAQIWEAEHLTLGRPVAIKFLHTTGSPQSEASQRFVREARVAAAVKHRNVVDIVDFGLTDGDHRPYMVMELLEGTTLNQYLEKRTRLPIGEAARIVSDMLRGLAAVHDAGIVHRDLKPDNIILVNDEDGPFPKLVDFGLSRKVGRGDMTAEGIILGTPDYMSPEQAQGQRHIDARTDIYSMGVIFYELVTGQMPFDGGTLAELLSRVVDGKSVPLTDRLPDAPPLLVDIISRAMHRDRNKRFANAREMRAALATANLAPFSHGESGLMHVEPPKAPAATPSGLFRDVQLPRESTTLDEAGQPALAPELEKTEAVGSPPVVEAPSVPPAAALAPTLPAMSAVVLPPGEASPRAAPVRRDESAGVFKVAEEAPPRRSSIWGPVVLVIALASIAGGLFVYWLETQSLPFVGGATEADAGAALVDAEAPLVGGAVDAASGAAAASDTGIEAPLDAGTSEPVIDAGEEEERPATRRRRRRPRRRR
jgi:serine/threonine-protein kinase